ncbi:MAG: PfkB family carbohydrate kinase [Candidatus Bathyarchaeota archaeon]|jgi:2-dehydro-3-deoxygluconokinase
MFDLVTVGHFAIDFISSPKIATPKPTLGGPATYTSIAAAKLGAKVSVISKVGEDFQNSHLEWLKTNGVDLSKLKQVNGAKTTKFTLTYKNGKRKLQLKTLAPHISPFDIPDSLQTKAVHIAPIANEIQNMVLTKLRKGTEILSLDPQGFIRFFDKKGNTHLRPWKTNKALAQIDIYKSSSREIRILTRLRELSSAMREIRSYGAKIIMVTRGMKGTILLADDSFYHIPACKPKVFQDPTGAGDAFIGAFLAEYVQGKELLWCACVGSAASSFAVEGIGPAVIGEKREVYARAERIYKKGLKQLSI